MAAAPKTLRACEDARLSALLIWRRALHYAQPELGHVRAASGLCWFQEQLAIVQDDALRLALLDPRAATGATAIDLPLRADGARLFDVERGNKADKPDLEACLVVEFAGLPALLAFGSGSTPKRECVALVQAAADAGDRSALIDAHALYASLRSLPDFLTSELNLEGAVLIGERLRLFQRSNGRALGAGPVLCASCDLPWPALAAYLRDPAGAPPAAENVCRYELGALAGTRLTFTDACLLRPGAVLFAASAESSPNAFEDGAVQGSALGKIEADALGLCLLRDERGEPVKDKVEGVALDPRDPTRAYLVFDPDDHRLPATLACAVLSGF
jgi:hypothetical protein